MSLIGLMGLFPEIYNLKYLLLFRASFEDNTNIKHVPEIYNLVLNFYLLCYRNEIFSNTHRMRIYSQLHNDYYLSNSLCNCGSLQSIVGNKITCTHPLCIPNDKKRCYLIRKEISPIIKNYTNLSCTCPCSYSNAKKHKIKNHICRVCKIKGHWTHECLLTNALKQDHIKNDYFTNKHKIYNIVVVIDLSSHLCKSIIFKTDDPFC